jgi:hypothetical protein
MKKLTTLPPTEAAPGNCGAEMPSPFPQLRETEDGRRRALVDASPTIAKERATNEAAVAEARRLEQEAEAALQARLSQAEVLRSLLADERKMVSQRAYFLGKPNEIEASIAEVEGNLNQAALGGFGEHGGQVWFVGIDRLVRLRTELAQVQRVQPVVAAELELIRTRRAEIQRELGFAVVGVNPENGAMETAEPHPVAA